MTESIQSKGGKARALNLSAEEKSAIASAAAQARWKRSERQFRISNSR
jgi:hypothetical protein